MSPSCGFGGRDIARKIGGPVPRWRWWVLLLGLVNISLVAQLPQLVGSVHLPRGNSLPGAYGRRLALSGLHLYVADGTNGVRILDVSDPAQPREIARAEPPRNGFVRDIALSGTVLVAAERGFGIWTIDVSRPDRPVTLGRLREPAQVEGVTVPFYDGVALRGSLVFATGGFFGVDLIDISDPSIPVYVNTVAGGLNTATVLPIGDDLVAFADKAEGLTIYRISAWDSVEPVSQLPGPFRVHGARGMIFRAPYLFLALSVNGYRVIDLRDPAEPRLAAGATLPEIERIASHGNLVVSASNATVGDISQLERPQDWKVFETARTCDVAVDARHIYLAHLDGTLAIYRRSDLSRRQLSLAILPTSSNEPRRIRVTGSPYGRVLVSWSTNHVRWNEVEYITAFSGEAEVLDLDPRPPFRSYRAIWNP